LYEGPGKLGWEEARRKKKGGSCENLHIGIRSKNNRKKAILVRMLATQKIVQSTTIAMRKKASVAKNAGSFRPSAGFWASTE
jgi:hypothetical protein